jgi:predicted Zn-dependent protease
MLRAARLYAFAILLAAILVGCSAPAPSAAFVAQAERLHQGALASVVTNNPDLRDYLQFIGKRIADAAHEAVPNRANEQLLAGLQCHLVDCPVINGFYTGGNHVYIYTALFQACQSEDELAAAIAHEYAHAINLDVEKTKLRPDPNRPLPAVTWQFVVNRFTLDQQAAADDLALQIYIRGGWDAARFAQFFDRLATVPTSVAIDRAPLPARAARLREQARDASRDSRKPPVADPKTFEALRHQAESQSQPAANPDAQLFLRAFPNCILSGDPPQTLEAQDKLRPPPPPPTKLEPS